MNEFTATREHGGPDPLGVPKYDFSTNSNACGPCPAALLAVQQADATRYPEASYQELRRRLAAFHDVAPERIVLAASASEFISRITALAASRGIHHVHVPRLAYGDYRHAAQAWRLTVSEAASTEAAPSQGLACLTWACDPSSPLGGPHAGLQAWADRCAQGQSIGVLDRAYEPLRLDGELGLSAAALDAVWQLFSPNKALGMTGVRAAHAVAPAQSASMVGAMESLCPSWPLGAHGVALLESWCEPQVQGWLAHTRDTLRTWKRAEEVLCADLGWTVLPSRANFFCVDARGLDHDLPTALGYLRLRGIKLRDAASFGLPGHFRLSVQPAEAQDALKVAWRDWLATIQGPNGAAR